MARKTYVLRDGKLVEKHRAAPLQQTKGPMIVPDIRPYRSPITGEVISSRPVERRHMAEHGVTRTDDYSPEWFERRNRERLEAFESRTPEDRRDRIEALKHALEKN